MQGFSTFLLIFCHLFTLSVTDIIIEDEEQSTANANINLNHRRLPLFPKKNMKFVVSPEPVNGIRYHQTYEKNIRPKMTLMPHLTPKYTVETTIASTKKPKRKPLMKLRTFTMKSHVNVELYSVKKDMVNKANLLKESTKATEVPATDSVINVYETHNNKVHSSKEISVKRLPAFITNVDNIVSTTAITVKDNKQHDNVIADEDRNEFIYIEEGGEEKDEEDMETTTNYDYITITKKKSRGKRNENIIVEENIASTTSPLKRYTDRDARLNNNYYFKNINV